MNNPRIQDKPQRRLIPLVNIVAGSPHKNRNNQLNSIHRTTVSVIKRGRIPCGLVSAID
jgi:hypothetical protein